ncbi:MAG: hypothetical protein NWP98_01430 [Erythrobacter sp.]|nr:hypothetical protein [Erythrobacter sp.]
MIIAGHRRKQHAARRKEIGSFRRSARGNFAHHFLQAPQTHCNIQEITLVAFPHFAQFARRRGKQVEANGLNRSPIGDENINLFKQASRFKLERQRSKARGICRIDRARLLGFDTLPGAAGMGHQKTGDNFTLDHGVDRVARGQFANRAFASNPFKRCGNHPAQQL